jgi:PTH1 family peptidyl-tRNA hydrolase
MRLIVGLGNPGSEYEATRHNVGFMAVEAIARRHGFSPWRRKFQGLLSDGVVGGSKVLALLPQTYMNLSGQSVGEALRFHRLAPEDAVVFHDELDLPPGRVKSKRGGGAGGHNGLRSLDQHIGPEYWRVRLGIGHPGRKELVHGYVLHPFAKADREWLEPLLDAVADCAPALAAGDAARFVSDVSLKTAPPKPPKPPRAPKPADAAAPRTADDSAGEA